MSIKWPSFILGGHNQLIRSDDGRVSKVIHAGSGPYYGISWDKDKMYVGARYMVWTQGTGSKIMTFDKEYGFTGWWPGGYPAFPEVHQIIYVKDKLYITVTRHNCVDVVDKQGNIKRKNWTDKNEDWNHINSIWWDGSNFFACHHNHTKESKLKPYTHSHIVKLNPELDTVLETIELGKDIHNVYIDGDWIYTCSSADRKFIRYNKANGQIDEIKLDKWVRGLAATKDYFVVGCSKLGWLRATRYKQGSCDVFLIDRKTFRVVDSRYFDGVGATFEIRVVGEKDFAHNGIDFPGK